MTSVHPGEAAYPRGDGSLVVLPPADLRADVVGLAGVAESQTPHSSSLGCCTNWFPPRVSSPSWPIRLVPFRPRKPLAKRRPRRTALGLELHVVYARTERDFDAAFTTLVKLRAGALVIAPDSLFGNRSGQLGALALRHAIPAISPYREFTAAGGLMSYGTNITNLYRQVGIYTSRILKGEKPADLPVQQAVKLVFPPRSSNHLGLGERSRMALRVAEPPWSGAAAPVAQGAWTTVCLKPAPRAPITLKHAVRNDARSGDLCGDGRDRARPGLC
jgi:ABC transporter substrate binding protein